ncbi:MAG: hypothetical protein ABI687_01660 [Flavitalea sp.]
MFTSKELYIMNGGNKTYIGKDGFADVYSATPVEEAEWSKEVVTRAIAIIDKEENAVSLEFAIDNLRFHKYTGLKDLLISKMQDTNIARHKVFAEALSATH